MLHRLLVVHGMVVQRWRVEELEDYFQVACLSEAADGKEIVHNNSGQASTSAPFHVVIKCGKFWTAKF